jgi:phosphoribosylglycinamide formyltransferase-1
MPKLLIFASGTATGGGSGFETLVENARVGILQAKIAGVVSNHADGGVRQKADHLGTPFIFFDGPWTAEAYQKIVKESGADYVALSGWLKLAAGLDPRKTINIHPAPLPEFGGDGLYGHRAHEAVLEAFRAGKVKNSAVSMHFVTEAYDRGPVFFEYPVAIRPDDTPETLAGRVNEIEHGWQSFITNLVVQGEISWDGENAESLKVPEWYRPYFLPTPK